MKKLLVCVGILASCTAWSAAPPVDSLNDLPSRWSGLAGDLLQQAPAVFEIRKILSVSREDGPQGFTATYDVEARLELGTRAIDIRRLELQVDRNYPRIQWVTIETSDELVPRLWAAISYDEVSDSYTLREMPRPGGERRFVLKAAAKR